MGFWNDVELPPLTEEEEYELEQWALAEEEANNGIH